MGGGTIEIWHPFEGEYNAIQYLLWMAQTAHATSNIHSGLQFSVCEFMQSATCSDYIHFGFVLFQIHLHFTFPCCDLNAVTLSLRTSTGCHLPMYGVLVSDFVQSDEFVVHLAGCLPHSSTITINFWFIWLWVVSSADSLATKFVPSSSSLLIAPGLFRFHNHSHNYLWVCSSSLCLFLIRCQFRGMTVDRIDPGFMCWCFTKCESYLLHHETHIRVIGRSN